VGERADLPIGLVIAVQNVAPERRADRPSGRTYRHIWRPPTTSSLTDVRQIHCGRKFACYSICYSNAPDSSGLYG
jgi:hypothetical protein